MDSLLQGFCLNHSIFYLACNAMAMIDVSPPSTYNWSIYDAMISAEGFSFSKANNDFVQIYLYLSGGSRNFANISFEIYKTHNVSVVLFGTDC